MSESAENTASSPRPPASAAEIAQALVTSRSRARAAAILALQGRGAEARAGQIPDSSKPPVHYRIPYYLPTAGQPVTDAAREALLSEDSLGRATAVDGVNENMRRAVQEAMATISAQLPGRFVFVQTDKPEEAVLDFSRAHGIQHSGITDMETGAISMRADRYNGPYNQLMAHIALHEIAHGLGLEHPDGFQKTEGGQSVDRTNFLDTAMILAPYGSDPEGDKFRQPVSLMAADLQAMISLYPIQQDALRVAAQAGPPPRALEDTAYIASLFQAGSVTTSLAVPQEGLTYHAATDGAADTIAQSRPSSAGLRLKQLPQGMLIQSSDRKGEVLVPIHAERVELTARSDVVTVIGDATVQAPANGDDHADMLIVSGRNNRLNMPVVGKDMPQVGVFLEKGAGLAITLRDTGKLTPDMDIQSLFVDMKSGIEASDASRFAVSWSDLGNGTFRWQLRDLADLTSSLTIIDIQLENATPEAIRTFRQILHNPIRMDGKSISSLEVTAISGQHEQPPSPGAVANMQRPESPPTLSDRAGER